MKDNSSLTDSFKRAKRLIEVLGKSSDLALAVLRSHLLLEEQLRDLVASVAREPERLVKARLSSSQVLALAHAFLGGPQNQFPWSFLAGLNRLRNRLAHEIEVPELEREVEHLTAIVPVFTDASIYPPDRVVYLFTLAVARVSGELHARGLAFVQHPGTAHAT